MFASLGAPGLMLVGFLGAVGAVTAAFLVDLAQCRLRGGRDCASRKG